MNGLSVGIREAMFYEKLDGKKVRCNLCPHHCTLGPDQVGFCGVRINSNGVLKTTVYGMASATHVDPIEKKPLFHLHPGSSVASFATVGCNMRCKHCQNWDISQSSIENMRLKELTVKDVLDFTKREDADGVAWTYNEPTVWYEFTYDASKAAKGHGLYSVYVTNGYIEREPLEKIAPYLDAMNIDVKAFTQEFYAKETSSRLKPVLATVERAKKRGILVELTYLVIPTKNDSRKEIDKFVSWVVERVGSDTPVHFSRFHPDYMTTDLPPTPMKTMDMAYDLAKKKGLDHVYMGNVWNTERESTYCPKCGSLLIQRRGYGIKTKGLKGNKCVKCGAQIPVVIQ